ncbi:flagellar biosynthesis protein FlhF [Halobacillus rhizosphaerae]|uniref:flagellar biosynthesis protein FlhF n=1 Tax=Halobacillus rhizosphaerae TaxID=3064889 RepID=UPI00398B69AF
MKIKKFIAPTMPEAMKKVRQELGPDAVILNSKNVKTGGFLGMFKKMNIEVIAALDPAASRGKVKEPYINRKNRLPENYPPASDSDEVLKELKHLKTLMKEQKQQPLFHDSCQKLYEHLLNQELDKELAHEFTTLVEGNQLSLNSMTSSKRDMVNMLSEKLGKTVQFPELYSKQFVHLVGPTGVGKTTTIAKIAADAMLNRDLNVALITIDTYRIAAIDQLRTYAKILDIPFEVAYNFEEYIAAREKFAKYDLILVDTAGRNFKEIFHVQELKETMDFNQNTATHLVLSLTSKERDMKEIIRNFKEIPVYQLIFTKTDEASVFGPAINIARQHEMGIAYLTNGQDVPDDIVKCTSNKLASLLMEDFE